jgi:hypothetical protein
MKSYRHYVLRRLLKLESLDGRPVSEAEQQAAMANTSSIKASMIKENAFVQRRSNWSPLPAYTHTHTHNTAHGCVQFNACMRTLKHMHTHSCVLLEELLMEENRVSKIENLSALVYLKKLDLGKNKIQRIECLEALSSLVQVVFVCVCLCMCVRSRAREIVQVVCVCVCARAPRAWVSTY